MDSYVIRIYRRDEKDPGKAAGQVEFVERGRVKSFTCVDELVKILGLKEKRAPGNKSKRSLAVQESKKQVRKKIIRAIESLSAKVPNGTRRKS